MIETQNVQAEIDPMASGRLNPTFGSFRQLFGGGCVAHQTDEQLLARFLEHRDEMAFEALVGRHGAMVRGVARKLLVDSGDLDDVFQAVFLVLATKAEALLAGQALGSWLYRVTARVSARANASARKRTEAARQLAEKLDRADQGVREDERTLHLHAELERLPEKYRAPIVLHYFEELSYEQIQAELSWSEGMVRNRLSRGKKLLRERLSGKGVVVGAGVLAELLSDFHSKADAATDVSLTHLTTLAAAGVLSKGSVSSASIARLVRHGVSGSIAGFQLKAAAAVVVLLSLVTGASQGFVGGPQKGVAQDHPGMKKAMSAEKPEVSGSVRQLLAGEDVQTIVSGRVLLPSGKPAANASVVYDRPRLTRDDRAFPERLEPSALTDAEGRFSFAISLPTTALAKEADPPVLAASLPGLAMGWVAIKKETDRNKITIKLAEDDAVEGRVIDLEGKPIAGVRVRPLSIASGADGTLKELESARDALKKRLGQEKPFHPLYGDKPPHDVLSSRVHREALFGVADATTDSDGAFRIKGVGAERLVGLRFEGGGIALEARSFVFTAPGEKFLCPVNFDNYYVDHYKYLPNRFTFVAAPSRTIEGMVTDEKTKLPIPGAELSVRFDYNLKPNRRYMGIETVADESGKYRLSGLPLDAPNQEVRIFAEGPKGSSYLPTEKGLSKRESEARSVMNFALLPGVRIVGKAVDAETGKPIAGLVHYAIDGRNFANIPRTMGGGLSTTTDPREGTFEMAVVRGKGVLLFSPVDPRYRMICKQNDDSKNEPKAASRFEPIPNHGFPDEPIFFLDVKDDEKEREVIFKLDLGSELRVKVVLPGGKAPTSLSVRGASGQPSLYKKPVLVKGQELVVTKISKSTPRFVLVHDESEMFGAAFKVPLKESESATIALQACGRIEGRLVDKNGNAMAGAKLHGGLDQGFDAAGWGEGFSLEQTTDSEGRFAAKGLLPGSAYSLYLYDEENVAQGQHVFKAMKLEAGERKDLGDVQVAE